MKIKRFMIVVFILATFQLLTGVSCAVERKPSGGSGGGRAFKAHDPGTASAVPRLVENQLGAAGRHSWKKVMLALLALTSKVAR